jgi:hypothetical protein
MDLDNALNLKAEILERVFGYRQLRGVAAHWSPGGIERPMFFMDHDPKSRASNSSETWPAARIAVAVTVPRARSTSREYGVVLYYQERRLRDHKILDRASRVGAGEVTTRFVGRVRKASGFNARDAHRPLRIGASVSHERTTAGTLSCFVKVENIAEPCLLSNNHVIAGVEGSQGDLVLQPGKLDGGRPGSHAVGQLHYKVPLHIGGQDINTVDCAVARLAPGMCPVAADAASLPPADKRSSGKRVPPTVLRSPDGLLAALGESVWKYGRTTAWTEGQVSAIEVTDLRVAMSSQGSIRVARFDGQIAVEGLPERGAFAKEGDSGGLLLTADGAAAGLIFAVSDDGGANGRRLAFANPMTEVLTHLGAGLYI